MKAYRRWTTVGQLAAAAVAFVGVALLLGSGALLQWAQRLDLGPERTLALPVAEAVHHALGWTGLERVRQQELTALARAGWSDDPEALAAARQAEQGGAATVAAAPRVAAVAATARPSAKPGTAHAAAGQPAAAAAVTAVAPAMPVSLAPVAGDPPLLSTLAALPEVRAGQQRTVAMAGDSMMAVGLSSSLLRQAPQHPDLRFVKAFKSGTGLARPEIFNWQQEYPAMLGTAQPDVVVVAIGANDGQGFVEDGVTYPFGSPGWRQIYERRVQQYLAMLEQGGASVIWVGLPPMKNPVMAAKMALINRIDYAVVSASPQAVWLSSAGLVGDANGGYRDFGEVRGSMTRLRQPDGVHMSDDGAQLLVGRLLRTLDPPPPPPATAEAGSAMAAGQH